MTDQPDDATSRIPTPGGAGVPGASPAVPPPAAVPVPPPPAVRRDDSGRLGSVIGGLVVLGIGLWFFAEQTLGYEMPDISWRQAWPLVLIAIGAWVVLGAARRRTP